MNAKIASKHYTLRRLIDLANLCPGADELLIEVRRAEEEAAQVHREWVNLDVSRPDSPSFKEFHDKLGRVFSQLERVRNEAIAPFWDAALAAFPVAPLESKLWGYAEGAEAVVIPTNRHDGLPVVFNHPDRLLEAVVAVQATFGRLASEVAAGPSRLPVELPLVVAPPRYQVMLDGSVYFGPDLFLDVVIPAIRDAGRDLRRVKRCAVCSKLFFARRHDSVACSKSCANVERVRRYRRKQPQYAENRRKNREAKKRRAGFHTRAVLARRKRL